MAERRKTIREMIEEAVEPREFERDPEEKPWPPEEDCPRCDGHREGEREDGSGKHRFSCLKNQRVISVNWVK